MSAIHWGALWRIPKVKTRPKLTQLTDWEREPQLEMLLHQKSVIHWVKHQGKHLELRNAISISFHLFMFFYHIYQISCNQKYFWAEFTIIWSRSRYQAKDFCLFIYKTMFNSTFKRWVTREIYSQMKISFTTLKVEHYSDVIKRKMIGSWIESKFCKEITRVPVEWRS